MRVRRASTSCETSLTILALSLGARVVNHLARRYAASAGDFCIRGWGTNHFALAREQNEVSARVSNGCAKEHGRSLVLDCHGVVCWQREVVYMWPWPQCTRKVQLGPSAVTGQPRDCETSMRPRPNPRQPPSTYTCIHIYIRTCAVFYAPIVIALLPLRKNKPLLSRLLACALRCSRATAPHTRPATLI